MVSEEKKSFLQTTTDTVVTFVALYVTTLFSMDTWHAARDSPYRSTINSNTYFRPSHPAPSRDTYQGQMYNGDRRPRTDFGGRNVHQADNRSAMPMPGSRMCGSCM